MSHHYSLMRDYFVYMLRCKDGKFYIGVTNDLRRRVHEHQEGFHSSSFTFSRRPVHLVYTAWFTDIHEAISWEKQIKRWSKAKKNALIAGSTSRLNFLSVCKNTSHHSFYVTDMYRSSFLRKYVGVVMVSPSTSSG